MSFVIRERQIKTTIKYCLTLRNKVIIRQITALVGKNMEKLEPSYTSEGNVKWCTQFWKHLAGPQIVKQKVIMWPRNSTSSYYVYSRKWRENMSKQNMYINIQNSIIHNSQTTQMTNNWQMHKNKTRYYLHNVVLIRNRK
jgi:hypothetical protein